jgi:hypothetical protein
MASGAMFAGSLSLWISFCKMSAGARNSCLRATDDTQDSFLLRCNRRLGLLSDNENGNLGRGIEEGRYSGAY